MPEVVIGARTIPYEIRRSARATRKRIEVSPRGVHIIVPADAPEEEVKRFVAAKRRWLHDKTDEVQNELARLRGDTPQGLHSGAKVLFRGRLLKLRVQRTDTDEPELTYRTGFHIAVPQAMAANRQDEAVRSLIDRWLQERVTEDAWEVVRRRGTPHRLAPRGIQIRNQRTLWGSCGRDRVLRLDRKLSRVPKPVFEYVVVHELCHLEHRDHSPAFWSLVKRVLPDYEERKDWLEAHEVALG
jgi:predicted metal-dependent hydrolase